jgi:hypothetical protein
MPVLSRDPRWQFIIAASLALSRTGSRVRKIFGIAEK